ncbi:MAG: hypothetical protein MSS76_03865 [Clostridium sp.]|nr:hypothetical protein [Clostridium sp.]
MDNREYIIALYEIYKELLNEKERNYFEYYYFEDYSMQEIADLYKVSKAYASKYLNKINDKIISYEKILKINDRNSKIIDLLKNVNDSELKSKIIELL